MLTIQDFLSKELLVEMGSTYHNSYDETPSPYHMENSVLAHTLLVKEQVLKLYNHSPTFRLLERVAYLHDIGKTKTLMPLTSKDGTTEHRTYQGHEGVSFYMASDYLNPINEMTLKVIACHGDLWKYKNSKIDINRFSDIRDKNLFNLVNDFSKCDRCGSITNNEIIDLEKYIEFYDNFQKYRVDLPKLTILVGPSGVGKSTYSKDFDSSTFTIISRDNLVNELEGETYSERFKLSIQAPHNNNIDNKLRNNFIDSIKNNKNIIIDMTCMTRKSRMKWIKLYKETCNRLFSGNNGYIDCVVVYNSYNTIIKNNIKRSQTSDKTINESIVLKQMKSFEYPKYSEGFNNIMLLF